MQLPVEVERASGVPLNPFADKQTKGESGEERMGSARDKRRGNPSVLTEQEDRREGWRESERERAQQRIAMYLRNRAKVYAAPDAWRPASTLDFDTHDNKGSLGVFKCFLK